MPRLSHYSQFAQYIIPKCCLSVLSCLLCYTNRVPSVLYIVSCSENVCLSVDTEGARGDSVLFVEEMQAATRPECYESRRILVMNTRTG